MQILVDYDNLPPLLSRNGPRLVADRIQERLFTAAPQLIPGDVRLDFRFYGGWHSRNAQSKRAIELLANLVSDFPSIVFDRSRGRRITISGSLAESLLALPQQILTHTYRVRSDAPRLQCVDGNAIGCLRSSCPTLVLQPLFRNRSCPEAGCVRGLDELVSRVEQKLVDTMLVTDMIYLAHQGVRALAVVSSDDDLWPGMLGAMAGGTTIVHLTTKYVSSAPTYLGTMQPKYITAPI